MDHLIRFTTAEGVEGTHHTSSLDEAIAFAERIRNAEGATDVRLFRLTEVPIEFKTYYRAEVGVAVEHEHHEPVPAQAGEPQHPDHAGPPVGELVARPVGPGPLDPAGANGRRLFSR
jgi:hypothetical protein